MRNYDQERNLVHLLLGRVKARTLYQRVKSDSRKLVMISRILITVIVIYLMKSRTIAIETAFK